MNGRTDIIIIPILYLIYFVLVHIGMITWLIAGFISVIKRRTNFRRVKIISGSVSMIAVWPAVWLIMDNFESNFIFSMVNLPAALIVYILTIFKFPSHSSGTPEWVGYAIVYSLYSVFGFIGGWGIGQILDWTLRKLRR